MHTMMIYSLSLVAALAVLVSGEARAELKVGDPAPAFELAASDGKTYKLADFKDKQVVVVAWFPKAFTGGCTAECKSMKEYGAAIKKFNVAYFTASCDAVDGDKGNKAFAESLGLDYPILSDPTRKTAIEYGLATSPTGNAKRVTFYIGKDGKILHIDAMVKTGAHGPDIAKKLEELGADKK